MIDRYICRHLTMQDFEAKENNIGMQRFNGSLELP